MTQLTFAERLPTRPCTYTARRFWSEHGEASLNWLALGLLLAAWNATDNEAANRGAQTTEAQPATWGPGARAANSVPAIYHGGFGIPR
jgi:hypothetical protein